MKISSGHVSRALLLVSGAVIGGTFIGWSASMAQEHPAPAPHLAVQTSVNALMVALVDDSAQVVWNAAYAKTLSDKDWQKVGGNAVKLNGAGALISLGGKGKSDMIWALTPLWQEKSQKLTDAAVLAQSAVTKKDQVALLKAGDALVASCEGCHTAFKVDPPTGGFYHIPVGLEVPRK